MGHLLVLLSLIDKIFIFIFLALFYFFVINSSYFFKLITGNAIYRSMQSLEKAYLPVNMQKRPLPWKVEIFSCNFKNPLKVILALNKAKGTKIRVITAYNQGQK